MSGIDGSASVEASVEITDELAAMLPELQDFERCKYLFTAQYRADGSGTNDPDVGLFWERALRAYCVALNTPVLNFEAARAAFSVNFVERGARGEPIGETQLQPLTMEAALIHLQRQGSFTACSDVQQLEAAAQGGGTEEDNGTGAKIWRALVNVISPTKAGAEALRASSTPSLGSSSSSSSAGHVGGQYACADLLDQCAACVREHAHGASYAEYRANCLAAEGVATAGRDPVAAAAVMYLSVAVEKRSAGGPTIEAPDLSGAAFADLLRSCVRYHASTGRCGPEATLLQRLLGAPGSGNMRAEELGAMLLANHMLRKGTMKRYISNVNIIKVLPLGTRKGFEPAAAEPTTPSSGLGLLTSLWSSPTALSHAGTDAGAEAGAAAGAGVTAEEAAALELQCHIADFERRLRALDSAMLEREQRAKKFLAQVVPGAAASDRFKARALQQLRAKKVLQQQYEVVSNAIGRLEEVQMRCASNAIYADVVDALRTGNQVLRSENVKGEALADEAADIVSEFESLKLEGDAVGRELAGEGVEEADADLREELRLLVEAGTAQSTAAAAAAASVEHVKTPTQTTSTTIAAVAAAMPAAPSAAPLPAQQEAQLTPPAKVRAGPFSS